MNYPIYNLIEGDVEKMSLVLHPAVETDFMCFSKEEPLPLKFNDEKRIITGVAMLADTPIFRNNPEYGEHYVVFTKETIASIVEKFMKHKRTCAVNLEHSEDVNRISLMESYLIDNTKITSKLFPDVPEGSWIVSYKVNNPDVYYQIKNGLLKGFSVEGLFTYGEKPINALNSDDTISLDEEIEKLL